MPDEIATIDGGRPGVDRTGELLGATEKFLGLLDEKKSRDREARELQERLTTADRDIADLRVKIANMILLHGDTPVVAHDHVWMAARHFGVSGGTRITLSVQKVATLPAVKE